MTNVQRHCGATQPFGDGLGDWVCLLPTGHDGDHQALDGDPWAHTWPNAAEPPPAPSAHWAGVYLAEAFTRAKHAAEDISDALMVMPDDLPLLTVCDLVRAQAHLKAARRLIDNAATITAQEVTR